MKKTIKETRDLMNKINEFLAEGEPYSVNPDFVKIADEFKMQNDAELEDVLGPRWETQGGDWTLDKRKEQFVHDLIWQYATENYPEHMGDEEKSEEFVNGVMSEL